MIELWVIVYDRTGDPRGMYVKPICYVTATEVMLLSGTEAAMRDELARLYGAK